MIIFQYVVKRELFSLSTLQLQHMLLYVCLNSTSVILTTYAPVINIAFIEEILSPHCTLFCHRYKLCFLIESTSSVRQEVRYEFYVGEKSKNHTILFIYLFIYILLGYISRGALQNEYHRCCCTDSY